MRALVANTDRRWFDFLGSIASDGRLDEVNFWRPQSQLAVRSVSPGAPFFLRLKRPINAVAGYGFFAAWHLLPMREAWRVFGQKNGAPTFVEFLERIGSFRREAVEMLARSSRPIGCVVLSHVQFLQPSDWIPWGEAEGWAKNIVVEKTVDLRSPPGDRLRDVVERPYADADEFAERFTLVDCDARTWNRVPVVQREGQGTFRVRLLGAYKNRCAITGERTVPALDAAHIQRYLGQASNHVQNGLILRSDLHGLFDDGYLTVTPDLVVEVSPRIREEFENGREYYRLHGSRLMVVPGRVAERPSADALAWHAENVYR
jgi:putative restriction endonuclease